jgi:hypothetical protein
LVVGGQAAQVLEDDEGLPADEFRGEPAWQEFPSSPALYEVVTEFASARQG